MIYATPRRDELELDNKSKHELSLLIKEELKNYRDISEKKVNKDSDIGCKDEITKI